MISRLRVLVVAAVRPRLSGLPTRWDLPMSAEVIDTSSLSASLRMIYYVNSILSYLSYLLHCCALPDKRCLSHGMLPLSGHDDVALFE